MTSQEVASLRRKLNLTGIGLVVCDIFEFILSVTVILVAVAMFPPYPPQAALLFVLGLGAFWAFSSSRRATMRFGFYKRDLFEIIKNNPNDNLNQVIAKCNEKARLADEKARMEKLQ